MMGFCWSRRSSHVVDTSNTSTSMEECLPQEMLEAVLAKLDRETLCTARLVSRAFCAAASANISSLIFRSPSQVAFREFFAETVSIRHFPRLGDVTVHYIGDDDSLAQLDPHVRASITRLTVQLTVRQGEDLVSMMLPELPKLCELDVNADGDEVDGVKVLQRVTSLEAIRIGACSPSAAPTIMTMTQLTSLVIGLASRPGEPADVSWLQHATNLRALEALEISVSHEALPLIANLTGLTGLTWLGSRDWDIDWDTVEGFTIAPLSRLSRLRSLDIVPCISDSDLAIACSLGSGSLAGLRLSPSPDTSADCGRLLARQTALTRLALGHAQLCTLRHMGAMRMELLQSLQLVLLNTVDAEAFDALHRATNLTKLSVSTFIKLPDMGLSEAVARLTRLRSLQLVLPCGWVDIPFLDVCQTLTPLTALTELLISTDPLDDGGLRALLGFTGLQVLQLHGPGLTAEVVPELAVLTNLRTLRVHSHPGVKSLWPATSILNPLRLARGWPPVDAICV